MQNMLSTKDFNSEIKNSVIQLLDRFFGIEAAAELYLDLHLQTYNKGEIIMNEGSVGKEMYIVLSGSLDVVVHFEHHPRVVGTIRKGECVGEMALLGDGKRSATVVAKRNCILVCIDIAQFELVKAHNQQLLLKLNQYIIERLKKVNQLHARKRVTNKFIAIIDNLGNTAFSQNILYYWGNAKQIKIVSEESHGHYTDLEFALEINKLEDYDYVILESSINENWNDRIKNNAEKLVFICEESDQAALLNANVKRSLNSANDIVCLQYNEAEPKNVAQWFNAFLPNQIFKYKKEHVEHIDRIVRIICEVPICLVFGGGGAHGLSNLGVVKALSELNIPIDIIGGTSIGSIFTAALAQDWPFDYVYNQIEKDISKHNPLSDYTWPFVALLKGKKMHKVLKKHFNLPMEHSWKNIFCVAANLSKAKTEIIQDGPLNLAIASSIAIPGVLPPQLYRKSLLIDGGVLNNLPADIMYKLYKGHIISVDVVSSKARSIEHQYKLTNWQLIKNSITSNRKNYVPNSMNTIMKAITLASAERAPEKEIISDYYIKPRIKKGFLAWKEMDDFVAEGYTSTMELLKNSNYLETLNLPERTQS